jgi:hypothetical protein
MPAKKSLSFRCRMKNVLQLPSVLSSETVVSNSKTLLRWGNDDNKGIVSSGWSLTRGAHICFKDEVATKDKVQLIIEEHPSLFPSLSPGHTSRILARTLPQKLKLMDIFLRRILLQVTATPQFGNE